jgi:hypothetical protein
MKKTLSTYEIAEKFIQDENACWSRAGAFALAEHLEELEADIGEEMELDVVAIRCDFSEYESLKAWADDYFADAEQAANAIGLTLAMDRESFEEEDDEIDNLIREYISNNGQLIEFDGGVIISQF